MKQHDLSYWEAMTERYFQAETTEEEEAQLRKFLCGSEAGDPRFDEIRATISFLHVCRQVKAPSYSPFGGVTKLQTSSIPKHSPKGGAGRGLQAIAVAACLCIAMLLGWYQYQQRNISCVRIAGEEIETDASLLMQQQMTEMFNPIDE